jgi:hypothetical protein
MDLYEHCSRCKGTGQDTVIVEGVPQSTPCPQCGATGLYKFGASGPEIDWIKKKIKKIMTKLEIQDDD